MRGQDGAGAAGQRKPAVARRREDRKTRRKPREDLDENDASEQIRPEARAKEQSRKRPVAQRGARRGGKKKPHFSLLPAPPPTRPLMRPSRPSARASPLRTQIHRFAAPFASNRRLRFPPRTATPRSRGLAAPPRCPRSGRSGPAHPRALHQPNARMPAEPHAPPPRDQWQFRPAESQRPIARSGMRLLARTLDAGERNVAAPVAPAPRGTLASLPSPSPPPSTGAPRPAHPRGPRPPLAPAPSPPTHPHAADHDHPAVRAGHHAAPGRALVFLHASLRLQLKRDFGGVERDGHGLRRRRRWKRIGESRGVGACGASVAAAHARPRAVARGTGGGRPDAALRLGARSGASHLCGARPDRARHKRLRKRKRGGVRRRRHLDGRSGKSSRGGRNEVGKKRGGLRRGREGRGDDRRHPGVEWICDGVMNSCRKTSAANRTPRWMFAFSDGMRPARAPRGARPRAAGGAAGSGW